ncbi:cupredoxin domain-containing protein [Fredinandcohnia sp. 179-A 10B2 NHS]|uniref:cupredoxin domain-containing protein n=1 Tax=Fredinandcohnia sp. 179-A 10B2 NHS TaxID=3235176 RepID=UPI00399F0F11
MTMKKWLRGLVGLLSVVVLMTTFSSFSVFAKFDSVTQKMNPIEVELNDDYFNPKVITISSGSTTTFLLKNKGKKEHTFTVEKLSIDVELQPGEEKSISVKPEKPGTYELICRYHFKKGMVGEVIVK